MSSDKKVIIGVFVDDILAASMRRKTPRQGRKAREAREMEDVAAERAAIEAALKGLHGV